MQCDLNELVTIVLAPSSQIRPLWETLLNFPPTPPEASNTVTSKPRDFSLYAAESPLIHHYTTHAKLLSNQTLIPTMHSNLRSLFFKKNSIIYNVTHLSSQNFPMKRKKFTWPQHQLQLLFWHGLKKKMAISNCMYQIKFFYKWEREREYLDYLVLKPRPYCETSVLW